MFTEAEFHQLRRLKDEMERLHTYVSDRKKWSVNEYWENDPVILASALHNVPLRSDCEDYAMTAMHKAMALGFNARLAVCYVETGEGHCICEVASRDGTQAYYLDNRFPALRTLGQLHGYRFLSVSPWNPQPGDKRPWLQVGRR